jgi:hypothetical protein
MDQISGQFVKTADVITVCPIYAAPSGFNRPFGSCVIGHGSDFDRADSLDQGIADTILIVCENKKTEGELLEKGPSDEPMLQPLFHISRLDSCFGK